MSAKLHIVGLKEPIYLSDEEGKLAESLIADTTKASQTPFSIEGIWTGTKRDMKFVTFIKETVYSESEEVEITEKEKAERDVALQETREWIKKQGWGNKYNSIN